MVFAYLGSAQQNMSYFVFTIERFSLRCYAMCFTSYVLNSSLIWVDFTIGFLDLHFEPVIGNLLPAIFIFLLFLVFFLAARLFFSPLLFVFLFGCIKMQLS